MEALKLSFNHIDLRKISICFTWDDNCFAHSALIAPEFSRRGLKCTFYINPGDEGFEKYAPCYKALSEASFETGSHSFNHYNLSGPPEEEALYQVKASADGKVTRIVPKTGENIAAGATVAVIESNQLYYDIYVNETQISGYTPGSRVPGYAAALKRNVEGEVRYITAAPQYANMRMSREKGQADATSFLVRIDVQRTPDLLPGMTLEVPAASS
jgi:hypothetical protein